MQYGSAIAWGGLACLLLQAGAMGAESQALGAEVSPQVRSFWASEFDGLCQGERVQPGANTNVFDDQSLVWKSDRNGLDVQLRRTKALIENLQKQPGTSNIAPFARLVAEIETQVADPSAAGNGDRVKDLYLKLRGITRQVSLSNPLLDFDDLLIMGYIKPDGDYHMVDQYVGWNARAGGGLFFVRGFKGAPAITNVLENSTVVGGRFQGKNLRDGAFLRPDLSFDGKHIAFAWNNIADRTYHIFTVKVDGAGLRQLTDGPANQGQLGTMDSGHNDFDPCWLPNGRIVFLSDRRGGYGRCHGRPLMSYTLHSMRDDGNDLIAISFHETNEWNPSVDRDGKLVYTRWDYIDRDDCIAHHLWTCFPDGRDPRAPHGNYPLPLTYKDADRPDGRLFRPNGEWNIRAIPNSRKYIATASGHHTHSFGELVMIDTRIPDDHKMSQVKGITTGTDRWPDRAGDYATAWPLSEDYYLCSYRGDIILLDRFGNRELLCAKELLPARVDAILHPIPLKARPAPPVIPEGTYQGERASPQAPKATISVMNVNSADMPLPDGTKVRWLRVVQIIPQLTPRINEARMGYATESLARMPLGVVPIEEDGSVYFKAPVERLLYFQLLNERGLAVRSMRSVTYVHRGETMNCVGCHEPPHTTPSVAGMPMALRRAPSDIKPEVSDGAMPFNWHRLVKPVLDMKCAACHREKAKPPDMSYGSLNNYVLHLPFTRDSYCNGDVVQSGSRTLPGSFGAMGSPLLKYLGKSHYDVALTDDEFRRITLWLDCNGNELGAYTKLDQQRRGEIVWPEIDVDPQNPIGVE